MKRALIVPPLLALYGLVGQYILHVYLPITATKDFPLWLGILIILFGFFLVVYTLRIFKKEETAIIPNGTPSTLIDDGVFRFSRNPIYLGMTTILIGSALIYGSISTFFIPLVFMAAVNLIWIRYEEKKLASIFGDDFKSYKERVRKWI